MAKKKEVYAYSSRFGTHSNMVLSDNGVLCICRDEFGKYLTQLNMVDNGLADRNRFDLVARGIDLKQYSKKGDK